MSPKVTHPTTACVQPSPAEADVYTKYTLSLCRERKMLSLTGSTIQRFWKLPFEMKTFAGTRQET